MGSRKITVKLSAAESIAAIAWFIESNLTLFAVNHKELLQVTNALPTKRNI